MMLTSRQRNVTFLGHTSVSDRTCVCGNVRAIHPRAARAAMGGCDPFERSACGTCGCQIDARGREKRARIENARSRGFSEAAECEPCAVCGAPAATVGLGDDRSGDYLRIPLCDVCLDEAESEAGDAATAPV